MGVMEPWLPQAGVSVCGGFCSTSADSPQAGNLQKGGPLGCDIYEETSSSRQPQPMPRGPSFG